MNLFFEKQLPDKANPIKLETKPKDLSNSKFDKSQPHFFVKSTLLIETKIISFETEIIFLEPEIIFLEPEIISFEPLGPTFEFVVVPDEAEIISFES